MAEKLIGKISHYFGNIGVAVLEITDEPVAVGDKIKVVGGETEFEQEIDSMQVDKNPVEKAEKGQSVGLKVSEKVREGYQVYKVEEQ